MLIVRHAEDDDETPRESAIVRLREALPLRTVGDLLRALGVPDNMPLQGIDRKEVLFELKETED